MNPSIANFSCRNLEVRSNRRQATPGSGNVRRSQRRAVRNLQAVKPVDPLPWQGIESVRSTAVALASTVESEPAWASYDDPICAKESCSADSRLPFWKRSHRFPAEIGGPSWPRRTADIIRTKPRPGRKACRTSCEGSAHFPSRSSTRHGPCCPRDLNISRDHCPGWHEDALILSHARARRFTGKS